MNKTMTINKAIKASTKIETPSQLYKYCKDEKLSVIWFKYILCLIGVQKFK